MAGEPSARPLYDHATARVVVLRRYSEPLVPPTPIKSPVGQWHQYGARPTALGSCVGPLTNDVEYVGQDLVSVSVTVATASLPDCVATASISGGTVELAPRPTALPPILRLKLCSRFSSGGLPVTSTYFQCSSHVEAPAVTTMKTSSVVVVMPCLLVLVPGNTSGAPTAAPPSPPESL